MDSHTHLSTWLIIKENWKILESWKVGKKVQPFTDFDFILDDWCESTVFGFNALIFISDGKGFRTFEIGISQNAQPIIDFN